MINKVGFLSVHNIGNNSNSNRSDDCESIPIILASGSPRRHELLARAGIKFKQMRVDIDESVRDCESPQAYIKRMVTSKAREACSQVTAQTVDNPRYPKLILTADTIGVLPDGISILVKPVDKQDAMNMWRKMSGNSHSIWTAVQLSLLDHCGNIVASKTVLESTDVEFVSLSSHDMEKYWNTGEPQDKAGGYAIQGIGAAWVKRINGSYTNVVGLPLAQTLSAIQAIKHQAGLI